MKEAMNHYQQLISSFTGKLLRDYFGKGPESVFVSIGSSCIAIYARKFLTPSERVLLEQKQGAIVDQVRGLLLERMAPEIANYIATVTGVRPEEIYCDWNVDSRTLMILGLTGESMLEVESDAAGYAGKQELEREISRISEEAASSQIASYEINARTLLVVRTGVLVRIEQELIRLGQSELLRRAKRDLAKRELLRSSAVEGILGRRIVDAFADWDFSRDRSVMLLLLA
ncbi:DUF2294 family protein [Paenibacillus sp. IB182496]|uniref:DUF2294 family protein n=1 Tax=Paenibacillus sabuli TaxID=2772509 RepID=A0A927BWS1_9BACL|nr:Na-translocating system protein MpsC family protein [Paenibacillus sabuli]MBD2846919.1 DUF2294 family protein [Paenibacillus sabuli]